MTASNSIEDLPADPEREIEALAEEFLAELQAGRAPDLVAVLAAHPDIAEQLKPRLALVERLFRAGQRAALVMPPSGGTAAAPAREAAGQAGERARRLKCPHCGNGIQLVEPRPREVTCLNCGSSFAVDPEATVTYRGTGPGSTIGRFQVLELLGRGAFGEVYKAYDPQLDRSVAVKIPRAEYFATVEEQQRFLREARSAAGLRHPGIVQVHEIADDSGFPYIVSDCIEGLTLADLISGGRPGFRESAELVALLADALDFAHRQKVIHRDIKPSNILLAASNFPPSATPGQGSRPGGIAGGDAQFVPYLTDFGLARREEGEITVTLDGQVLGTPAYMSPEQAAGDHQNIDGRSDVYSLGVVLYELLSGELPFRGNRRMLLHQVLHDEPRSPRTLNDQIPRDLETVCLKAMAKEPARRYATAAEFADDLRRFLRGDAVRARPVGRSEKIVRWCRRKPAAAGLIAAIAAILLLSALGGSWIALQERTSALKERGLRKDIAGALEESKTRLTQHYVASGVRLMDEHDLPGSLVWFAEALQLDRSDPEREHAHRVRLAAVLRQCPRLVQVWSHDQAVTQAEFIPNSRLVFTVSADTVQLWNLDTGEAAVPPLKHSERVNHAASSSDGVYLVTSCQDGAARVWTVANGRLNGAELRHARAVNNASFSPDGRLIATASDDKTAGIWDAVTGQPLLAPIPHDGAVSLAAFSPGGARLLTTSRGHNVCTAWIWDAVTGNAIARSPLHADDGWIGASWSPDGLRLASYYSSDIKAAWIWDSASGIEKTPRIAQGFDVADARFSPDGALIATAGNYGGHWAGDDGAAAEARVWDAKTGQAVSPPIRQWAELNAIAFSPDGGSVATACDDGTARIWDAVQGDALTPPLWHARAVRQVQFSRDGRFLLTASSDGTARLWDLAVDDPEPPELFESERGWHAEARSSDGRHLATGTRDGGVRIIDLVDGHSIEIPRAHADVIEAIRFSPDGDRLLTAGKDKMARIWNARTGRPLSPPMEHRMGVYDVRFSVDGHLVATGADPWRPMATSGYDAGEVRIWDGHTGEPVTLPLNMSYTVYDLGFSRDGRLIAACCSDRSLPKSEICVWESKTGQLVRKFAVETVVEEVELSPDGRKLVTASRNNFAGVDDDARVWDLESGEQIFSLRHGGGVMSASFSRDGRQLVTASADGGARIWDLTTGDLVVAPMLHHRALHWARFTDDARQVVTVGARGMIRIWDASSGNPLSPDLHGGFDVAWLEPGDSVGRRGLNYRASSVWKPPFDSRPAGDWKLTAEVLAGRHLDPTGALSALDAKQLQESWRKLRREYPGDFVRPSEHEVGWHRREVVRLAGQRKWGAAAGHFAWLAEADPSRRRVYELGLATAQLKSGDYEDAAMRFSRALESTPGNFALRRARSLCYRKLERWTEAAADAASLIANGAKDTDLWSEHGVLQLRSGNIEAYRQACIRMLDEFDSDDAESLPYNTLAWISVYGPSAVQDMSRIVALAEKAIENDGRTHAVVNTWGAALFRAERFEEALRAFDEGISSGGNEAMLEDWVFMAMTYFRLGRSEKAVELLEKSKAWLANQKGVSAAAENSTSWDQELLREVLLTEAQKLIEGNQMPTEASVD